MRTLRSKSVLIPLIIIILLSGALVPFAKSLSFQTGPAQQFNVSSVIYGGTQGYHVLAYGFNSVGDPLSGMSLNLNFSNPQSSTLGFVGSAQTNSSGYATFNIGANQISPQAENQFTLTVTYGSTSFAQTGGVFVSNSGGAAVPITSAFNLVADPSNSTKTRVHVFYSAPAGNSPKGYAVYYFVTPKGTGSNTVPGFNESNGTLLGTLNGYHQAFDIKVPPSQDGLVEFGIFQPNGTLASPGFSIFRTADFNIASAALSSSVIVTAFVAGVLGLFIPLMTVLASYSTYGKDRVNGVLDSIISRPITRRGLSLSRYTSVVLALAVAIIATVVVLDLISGTVLGSYLTSNFVLATIGSLIVEAAAFVGIVFLLSHLLKSSGALVGISVTLWAVFDFFWTILIFAITAGLGYGAGSANATRITILSEFANPAQFYSLVGTYLSNTSVSSVGGGIAIQPSAYGVTAVTVTAAGIAWVVVPLAIFLWLATKRD